jgi:hypothetical protein
MKDKIDQVLDHCLAEIQAGKMTLEEALALYPRHAQELQALLPMAIQTWAELAPDDPDPAYLYKSQQRILGAVRSASRRKKQHTPKGRHFSLRPAYALVIITLLAVLFGSGFGVYSASASSLPGDLLYPVKLAGEQIQLAASFSNEGDIQLLLGFAERRLGEVQSLINAERFDDLDQALNGFEQEMERLGEHLGGDDGPAAPMDQLQEQLEKHIQNLERVREQVPENAKFSIEKAIERSQHSQAVLDALQQGQSPSDLAPGQQDKESDKERGPKSPNGNGRPDDAGNPKNQDKDNDKD